MKNRRITLNGTRFTLGNRYRDKLLGVEGVATAGISYLTGCDQLLLSFTDTAGRPADLWVDVTRVEGLKVEKRKGGPPPNIPTAPPCPR